MTGSEQRSCYCSPEHSEAIQKAVDEIFDKDGESSLRCLSFSFTLSDPFMQDCPMIGCSSGFSAMCGYQMHEILGRNCRFLADPVPPELLERSVRTVAREFCAAVAQKKTFTLPDELRQPWMPHGQSDDGVFCIQTNAKKDGSLFKNLFHLKKVVLDGRTLILGLQTELPADEEGSPELTLMLKACQRYKDNISAAEKILSKMFWYEGSMSRQESRGETRELLD